MGLFSTDSTFEKKALKNVNVIVPPDKINP